MESGHSFKGSLEQNGRANSSSPEVFLEALHAELGTFPQPHVVSQDLEKAPVEEVLKDIHRAIYGNGTRTSGLNWKVAEVNVLLRDTINKHHACRAEMVRHLQEDATDRMQRQFGILGMAHMYPRVALIAVLLLFLGVSTLWSIVLQGRQATQTEQIVTALVERVVDMKLSKQNESH